MGDLAVLLNCFFFDCYIYIYYYYYQGLFLASGLTLVESLQCEKPMRLWCSE